MPAAEGKDVDGEPGFNFFRRSSGLACVAGIMPSQGAAFAPFVWLSAMWGLYATSLRQSPMATKALTAGVLAVGGDIAAQCFEFKQSGRQGAFVKVRMKSWGKESPLCRSVSSRSPPARAVA